MALDLSGARAKIDRAKVHLDEIKTALKLVLGAVPDAHPVATQIDPQTQELVITIPKAAPINPMLPLMIGDYVHNLRSALDHLVYALAVKNGAGSKAATKTFFPVCVKSSEFDDRPKKLVEPYISSAAFAEIKRCQPYTAYDIPEQADIWVLHKLDIIDKHRLLIVASEKFAATEFTMILPNQPARHQVIPEPKWKPMEDGAEVIRLRLSGPDRPSKVQMKTTLGRTVEFINTGLVCDGMPVVPVLYQIMGLVSAIVRDFGKQFFDE